MSPKVLNPRMLGEHGEVHVVLTFKKVKVSSQGKLAIRLALSVSLPTGD